MKPKRLFFSLLLLTAGLIFLPFAHAQDSDDDFVTKDLPIVTGTITEITSFWDEQGRIYTLATLQIDEQLAGETLPNTITLHYFGGTVGKITMHIETEPQLVVGDQITVPLKQWDSTSYRIDGGMDSVEFLRHGVTPNYAFLGGKWAHNAMPVPYYINQNGTSDTNGEFAAVQAAYNVWNNVSCAWIEYSYQGTIGNNPGAYDGKNVVGWLSNSASLCPDAAACAPYWTMNGFIVETDIIYNESRAWSIGGANDIQGIGVHEAGHNIGLNHSSDPNAVMYPYYSNGVLWRTLKQDDINGACALYPPDAIPPTVSINSGPTTWLTQNQTIFSWNGSDDQTPTGSLVYSYRIANVTSWSGWGSGTSSTITNLPDGWHIFEVKAKDEAGNESNIAQRSFGTDITPPSNPNSVNSGCNAVNNVWQNSCNDANFTWSGASDGNGIGVKDYQYYWGTSSTGTPNVYTTNAGFNPPAIPEAWAVYYLRVATRDQLNRQNSNPSTIFVLRYDGAKPTVAAQINNGSTVANQINVTINPSASDTGSGVAQVRVSNNGVDWSAWQAYQAGMSVPWALPAVNRQEHTVYVQVKDAAGNLSDPASDTITLELYPLAPHSVNYRLCASVVNTAGRAGLESATYRLTSNVGEVAIGGQAGGAWRAQVGFLADLENCRSIEYAAGEPVELVNWVIASGGGLRGNSNYLLGDTLGQTAASGHQTFGSASYKLTSGFWSGGQVSGNPPPTPTPTVVPPTPTATATPVATSTPIPTTFSVSINAGKQYTNNPNVTINLTAPNVTHVRMSNDGGYADNSWQVYQSTVNWTLNTSGNYIVPRIVYVWFKDATGIVYGIYLDDIIYDPVAPEGEVSLLSNDGAIFGVLLSASDDNSGVKDMRISSNPTFGDTDWRSYTEMISWEQPQSTIYAQFRDAADNVSEVYSSEPVTTEEGDVYLPMIIR